MRRRIDEDYVAAVRKAAEAHGSQCDLARAAGIPHGTISSLLNSKTPRKYVLSTVYNRLYPFVSPYLPEQSEIPIGPAVPPPPLPTAAAPTVNPYYVNTINNNVAAGGAAQVPVMEPEADVIKTSSVPVEVILHAMQGQSTEEKERFIAVLHAMQGMSVSEKAQFIKEIYTDCSHETDSGEIDG